MYRILIAAAAVAVLAVHVQAQPTVGQPVVVAQNATGSYGMRVDTTSQTLSTLNFGVNQTTHAVSAVQMDSNNMRVLFAANARGAGTSYIGAYDPSNQSVTTLATAPSNRFNALVPGQDGGYYSYDGTTVLKISQTGQISTLRANLPATISALGLDAASAALLVGTVSGHLWSMPQNGQTLSTVATGLGNVRSVDSSAQTGNYVVTTTQSPELRVLNRTTGALVAFYVLANITSAWVDQVTGHVWMTELYKMFELTAALTVLNSWQWANPQLAILSGMFYAWRVIAGNGVLTPGVPFFLSFYFPSMPAAAYIAALALSTRPGILIGGGRRINLALDALFLLTVVNGLFVSSFQGFLNANGGAMASVTIPRGLPPGILFFCAVIAVLQNRIEVSNSFPMMC